jgi:chorismate dehydratase
MKRYRIGAVGYLNARPLVQGLEHSSVPLDVRFDVPSTCAALLHAGAIDIGMIPSIEYLARSDYGIVAGVGVASDRHVASVALFSRVPVGRIQRIALDTSSRTSAMLLRVLCAERFGIAPLFEPAAPQLESMLAGRDAALLIGDPALFADPDRLGVLKIDLGAEWNAHTDLPFVWAFWAGRRTALDDDVCGALMRARDEGRAAIDQIAAEYAKGDAWTASRVAAYLRQNIRHDLEEAHEAALARFFASAAKLGLVAAPEPLRFFGPAVARTPDRASYGEAG